MAEELVSDEQQAEALRRWWAENWRWVLAGIVLGLAVLGGWQYWQQRKIARAEAAEQTYRDFGSALNTGDRSKAEALLKELEQQYGGSPYVDLGHLAFASAAVNAGLFEQAASELKTLAEHTDDKALKSVAKLRLARVQIQLGHHDEALAALDVSQVGAFVAQYHEVRGDALLAKGDKSGAQQAYQLSLDALQAQAGGDPAPTGTADAALVRLKLQELQVPAAAAPESTPAPASK